MPSRLRLHSSNHETCFQRSNGIAISLSSLKRSKTLSILALLLFAARIGHAQTASQRYLDDVKHLTVPSMEGRGDGTKGLTRAAHLIEQRYKSLGLEPAGVQSYFQPFAVVTGARLKADNSLHVQNGQARTALKLNQDFVPFSFSSFGIASGALVFAGYGASAAEFNYDDYANLDVKDKIVVLLRYEPPGFANHDKTGLPSILSSLPKPSTPETTEPKPSSW